MIIAAALLTLLALSPLAVILGRFSWSHALVYAASGAAATTLLFAGIGHFLDNPDHLVPQLVLPFGLPWIKAHFRVDALSSFFLVVINLSAALCSLFAIGYGSHVPEPRRVTPFYPLFLFGMNAVLVADDAFVFLVSWEFMSLSSWLLVLSDHRRPENQAAGIIYLVMAAFGTFCLLPAFGLMAGPGGDYTFAAMRAGHLAPLAASLVVLLALFGAGSKAGIVPLHAWLPLAHPAAPSHVSALMSGVMTKVALYGLIRILFDLHGHVAWQWGAAMMVIGGVTAVLGVMYAVLQADLKRVLAFSTVENIGVAVIGLGLAVAFRDKQLPALAALALVAALYHMLNHSLFKSLLFLGAGSVLTATGQRRLDAMGGLIHRMPMTAITMLIGAAAISALPPLNGFVSEWLIFQALFRGPDLPLWTMKFGVPVVGAMLALAAALAASCFVRVYGIAFLGRPRSPEAASANEVNTPMWLAMAILAGLCIGLGVVPVTVSTALGVVVEPLVGVALLPSADMGWPWLSPIAGARGSYSGTMVTLTVVAMLITIVLGTRLVGKRPVRRTAAWDCGHREVNIFTQYGADSFSQPLRRVFGTTLFLAREVVEMPEPGDIAPARLTVHLFDPVWDGIYMRLLRAVTFIAGKVNYLQFLTVRRYLLLMFMTLVTLLVVVALRQ